ncbi:hypothetical protein V5N11_001918 [Cardamine amara subsp. amara]|uniref:Stress response protein NST1 n=1 Tax=Cardamine amara subsp. amara TaxID=228776 RepID=A0ABD1AU58_CARAN
MNTNKCKKMPGLTQRNEHYSSGFWSKDVDGVSYNHLHKFWSELSQKARQDLLRIDKQALFEQARKNMCCSRCHGLLLEGFSQIVSYGKSLQQKGYVGSLSCKRSGSTKDQIDCKSVVRNRCMGEFQDPGVHQWGGLTTTRDGSLTLLDCYLNVKSFKGLQTVFESARARERERELLYPDACGGGGRVWLSQGMVGYGKGHGTRETCALHTTRLSCDTLVDFWSALEEESRRSLLRMKEEDFVERLAYRFDCKKFCRDCRRNVIREFKELKELKRSQREPHCTDWFCVADTAFQYEVDIDSVRADWSQYFSETAGYHQFEWAIGTGEGESDILEFKYVGNARSAQVNGLDLRGLHECYITLRAFRKNGRSSKISVKAHALRGQQCVHSRLEVGEGFVSIKRGECIRMFFEHGEEAEEEEDEVMVDKDGNELDGECLRPQKHAKSPELAREFLLDAAAVIFKEQVEKAFREGTARQNAHSIFVCLSSKLLEQRVHIACKEIVTLEKQKKLLEEEEKEKREEEERKERKRTKEREKKLRRKERLKEKEREKEQKNPKLSDQPMLPNLTREEDCSLNLDEETNNTISCEESGIENGDVDFSPPGSPDDQDEECLDGCTSPRAEIHYCDSADREIIDHEDENGGFTNNNPRPVHQTAKFWKELEPDHALMWSSDKRRYPEKASFVSRADHSGNSRGCRNFIYSTEEDKKMEVHIKANNDDLYSKDPMMSRTSSSDSCSSCLSEGESNTASSNNGHTESSLMSDSEDASQQSEGREDLVDTGNNMPDCHEKMTEKETEKSIDERDVLRIKNMCNPPADNEESKFLGTTFTVPSQNMENMIPTVNTGSYLSQPQSMMFPQMLNQSIPLSIFQTPTMGYYHQAPVSWSGVPANRLIPFPHPNQYVYTGTLGFSMNGESPLCMQYGTPLNHSATPFFNSGPVPVFHQFVETNTINILDHAQTLEPQEHSSLKEADERKFNQMEPPSIGVPQTDSDENFSLFHFGGPVALSTGSKSNPAHFKDGGLGDFSLQFSGDHGFGDLTGNSKKEKLSTVGEEYNLFAASNSLSFSIF